MGKVFSYFKRALPLTKKAAGVSARPEHRLYAARDRLQQRRAAWREQEPSPGRRHGKVRAAETPASRGYSVWAKDCVIFPLRNAEHKIVSLYGRSITNDSDQRHFYLAGREGLYPGYPKAATTRLILVESVIDAASILQQHELTIQYELLALYGTNGLTEEHLQAILALKHLEEIIFMLNGDEAGKAATAKHCTTLHTLLPTVKLTTVAVPDGEDVNSLLQTHDDPRVLADLIGAANGLFFFN